MRKLFGNILFFSLYPVWIILSLVWWRGDSAFMLRHIRWGMTGADYR